MVSVSELDVLGDSDSVLGDLGAAERSVEDDISASGSKSDLDCIGKHLAAFKHEGTCLISELDVLSSSEEVLRSSHDGSVAHSLP